MCCSASIHIAIRLQLQLLHIVLLRYYYNNYQILSKRIYIDMNLRSSKGTPKRCRSQVPTQLLAKLNPLRSIHYSQLKYDTKCIFSKLHWTKLPICNAYPTQPGAMECGMFGWRFPHFRSNIRLPLHQASPLLCKSALMFANTRLD